jgi:hypothetical protein
MRIKEGKVGAAVAMAVPIRLDIGGKIDSMRSMDKAVAIEAYGALKDGGMERSV